MNFRRTAAALAIVFATAGISAVCQVAPSAEAGGLPLMAGAGASLFNMDWGHDQFGQPRYMEGVTGWVDWNLTRLPGPALLRGLSVEIELRDISFGVPNSLSNANVGDTGTNLRQDTGLGGVTYTWRRYRRVHPYGKALARIVCTDGTTWHTAEIAAPAKRTARAAAVRLKFILSLL